MSKKSDPDWEVVDELPGENKPKPRQGSITRYLKTKALWIGLIFGVTLVILVPFLRVILQNALRAWWIWLGLALYWIWRRMNRSGKKQSR